MTARPRDIPLFLAYQALSLLFAILPRRVCLALGRALGLLAFRLDSKHRFLAVKNLRLAFGSRMTPAELRRTAGECFARFGRVLADIVKMERLGRERLDSLAELEGGDNLKRALARGRGALLFTGHFGNWEAGSLAVSRIAPLHVIARRLDNELVEKRLLSLRRRLGARVIYKHRAARSVLEVLRRNEVVAIVIDQNVLRREAVFVDFFGRPAGTTPGLAAFHLKSGAPLLPIFSFPRGDGGYLIRVGPPLETPAGGSPAENTLKITQACTKIIEARVRDAPESWLWFHDRWRSRPAEDDG